jgi:hypothetical protein
MLSAQHIIDGCFNEEPEDLNAEDLEEDISHWVDDALDYIRVYGVLEEDDYQPFVGVKRPIIERTKQ